MIKSKSSKNILIFALHPITYQLPIFKKLNSIIRERKLDFNMHVYFGDNLTMKEIYNDEFLSNITPITEVDLKGFNYKFLWNFGNANSTGFFSRLNPHLIYELFCLKPGSIVLIHGYNSASSLITLITSKLLGMKVLWRGEVTLKDKQPISFTEKLVALAKYYFVKIFLKFSDVVFFSCMGNYNFLKHHKVPENKLKFFPCAVDNELYLNYKIKNKLNRSNIRYDLGISPSNIVFLFVGRLTKRKNPLDIVSAAAKINNKNILCLFVGDGPELKNLEDLSSELSVRSIFVGYCKPTEIMNYYIAADCFVIPSEYDPSPKVVNEAMNFELPVVCSKSIGTAGDLVVDSKNGYIFAVGDITQLAEKMDLIASDAALRCKLGLEASKTVADWSIQHDCEAIISEIEKNL